MLSTSTNPQLVAALRLGFPSPSSFRLKEAWMCKNLGSLLKCHAISKPQTQLELYRIPVIKWNEIEDDLQDEETNKEDLTSEQIELVRSMLRSMSDGEINASAYDVAWVALVEDVGLPQFPFALEWISKNQHPDGSWGDSLLFSAHDRIISTLACVTALKTWNVHPEKVHRGLKFMEQNMGKLEEEKAEHMPIGFEVAFPNLLELAKAVDIKVPDSPFLKEIYVQRDLKLTRIPKDLMHIIPTTLLHSLEGMRGLDWEKLLKLQCEDGSFLFSPSSTAYALMQTKDQKCLNYLEKVVKRFQGGVPNVYPVDLFEHIWAVDRLQRLGISRYFQPEINQCLQYVHRYWTEKGICWARNTRVEDIDDTAMGFRLLRLHGFEVSPDVFRNFKKGEEFVCFAGQSSGAVTGMFNLYRASQVQFPGEKILDEAKSYTYKYLRQKQACGELFDKWIITKDLPGEVGYALEVPLYASLPRLESRIYIDQYGGENDVWIGKTLYRMPYVNNDTYLEVAKSDYNKCQALHQLEWDSLEKWYSKCGGGIFEELGIGTKNLLVSYYLAASSVFEPERSAERLAWAKSAILIESLVSYVHSDGTTSSAEQKKISFLNEFTSNSLKKLAQANRRSNHCRNSLKSNKVEQELAFILLHFLHQLSLDSQLASETDTFSYCCQAWDKWMTTLDQEQGDKFGQEAVLLVQTLHMSANKTIPNAVSHPMYIQLSSLVNKLCAHLRHNQVRQDTNLKMEQLMQLVLQKSDSKDDLDVNIKQTFFSVARSFYYIAYCSPATVNDHITKVLFERVK